MPRWQVIVPPCAGKNKQFCKFNSRPSHYCCMIFHDLVRVPYYHQTTIISIPKNQPQMPVLPIVRESWGCMGMGGLVWYIYSFIPIVSFKQTKWLVLLEYGMRSLTELPPEANEGLFWFYTNMSIQDQIKNAKVHFFSKDELSLTLDNSVNTKSNGLIHTRQ